MHKAKEPVLIIPGSFQGLSQETALNVPSAQCNFNCILKQREKNLHRREEVHKTARDLLKKKKKISGVTVT